MKRALVLGGGGAKGSYQAGAVIALREMGIEFDLVTGTSIGALNGCLVAQHDYDTLEDIWFKLKASDVIADGISIDLDLGRLMREKDEILPFLQGVIKSGVDISPFKAMIERALDEDRLMQSKTDYGLTYVRADDLKLMTKTKTQMPKPLIKEYLLASASCYPAFPMQEIEEIRYIDGGYRDNVPVALARKMGATEFIVIPLDEDHLPKLDNYENITLIKPFDSLGSFLNFDHEHIMYNRQRGYLDAYKAMGQYGGMHYTFEEVDPSRVVALVRISECLSEWLPLQLEKKLILNQWHYHWQQQLHPYGVFNYLHLALRMVEVMGEALQLEPVKVYQLSGFIDDIAQRLVENRNQFSDLDRKSFRKISDFDKLIELLKKEDLSLGSAILMNMVENWLQEQIHLSSALSYALLINEKVMAMVIMVMYLRNQCDNDTQEAR